MRKILWKWAVAICANYLRFAHKMSIGKNCVISWTAHLDKSINPRGIHIGNNVWILRGAIVLAHDHCRGIKADTYIGDNSVIGINSIIMPGVTIGEQCIVGGGAIVTKDVPSNCSVAGNPAKIIRTGIKVKNGKILDV